MAASTFVLHHGSPPTNKNTRKWVLLDVLPIGELHVADAASSLQCPWRRWI